MARFDIGMNIKKPRVQLCTRELFEKLLNAPHQEQICKQIDQLFARYERGEMTKREYKEAIKPLKEKLIYSTPHAHFSDNYRHNQSGEASGLVLLDVDGIEHPQQLYEEHLRGREQELGVVYADISPSRLGLHVIFLCPEGMTIPQAQEWMASEMGGVEYDGVTHELARATFMVPKDHVMYVDMEGLFRPTPDSPPEPVQEEHSVLPSRHPIREGAVTNEGRAQGGHTSQPAASNADAQSNDSAPSLIGRAGGESGAGGESLSIFDAVFQASGLPAEHLVTDGHLHTTLLILLSRGLAKMLTRQQLEPVLQVRMPTYAGCDDCRKLLDSAYDDYKMQNRTMTQQQMGIYTKAVAATEGAKQEAEETDTMAKSVALPPLPERLPALIALYTDANLDNSFKPAVVMNIFPALGIHLEDVHFTDNATLSVEASLPALLIAPPQAGKSCINAPILATNYDIQAQDDAYRAQMEAWNQQVKSLGANANRPPEPKCPIQICMHDMTSAALLKRLTAAQPRFLFTKMDEI